MVDQSLIDKLSAIRNDLGKTGHGWHDTISEAIAIICQHTATPGVVERVAKAIKDNLNDGIGQYQGITIQFDNYTKAAKAAIKEMQSIGVTKEPRAESVNSEQQGSVSAKAPTDRNHAPCDITSEISDTVRAKFEAWADNERLEISRWIATPDKYDHLQTQLCWEAFQAATSEPVLSVANIHSKIKDRQYLSKDEVTRVLDAAGVIYVD